MIDLIKARPFHAVLVVIALVLVVGMLTFAGPCVHDDGSKSVCSDAGTALVIAGAIGAVAALASLAVGNKVASGACALIAACCGAFAAASPGNLFALCMMQTMRCWSVMRPFAIACGACLLIIGIIAAVMSFRSKRQSRP